LPELNDWQINADYTEISKAFEFKNFFRQRKKIFLGVESWGQVFTFHIKILSAEIWHSVS